MAYPSVSLSSLNGFARTFVAPGGRLEVDPPANCMLNDSFSGASLDTTYRWNAPVLAGAGAATQANGFLALTTGTGASAAAAVSSIESFQPVVPGFLNYGGLAIMEALPSINTHRFVGNGTPNSTAFTAATPLQDACGWEFDITGALNACVYAGGVRTKAIPWTTPLNGIPTILAVLFRADFAYFFFNNLEEPVIQIPLPAPNFDSLPFRMHLINHTSGPALAPTWTLSQVAVTDTGNNYQPIYTGQAIVRARSPGKFVNINGVAISSETTIWTPASGRKFRVMGYVLTSGTVGGNVVLKDNTAGTTILVLPFGAAAGTIVSPVMGNGILSAAANNVLTATGAATQTLSGYLFGTEE